MTKIIFALDHQIGDRKHHAGKSADVDELTARDLIHKGYARTADATTTQAIPADDKKEKANG